MGAIHPNVDLVLPDFQCTNETFKNTIDFQRNLKSKLGCMLSSPTSFTKRLRSLMSRRSLVLSVLLCSPLLIAQLMPLGSLLPATAYEEQLESMSEESENRSSSAESEQFVRHRSDRRQAVLRRLVTGIPLAVSRCDGRSTQFLFNRGSIRIDFDVYLRPKRC